MSDAPPPGTSAAPEPPPAPPPVDIPPARPDGVALGAPPPPPRRRRFPAWAILVVVAVVLVAVAIVANQLARHNSRFTIIESASTDNTFHAGDCVTLSTVKVNAADCGSTHDGQIIQVIHTTGACPAGTDEYDVKDGTGNLCVDRGNSKR